ncbi:MAG: PulJ/GspJ family protein [Verrucomicrobiales bacterium]
MQLQCSNNGIYKGESIMRTRLHATPRGFSVIELLLAIVIMGVITFALYSVFNQTQLALRSSETQGDVSDRGRAILEMVSREVEQAVPTFDQSGINMFGELEAEPTVFGDERNPAISRARTNYLYNFLFFNKPTNTWNAVGYRIIGGTNGVGTLFRFGTNNLGRFPYTTEIMPKFYANYNTLNDFATNYHDFHYVAGGVVHFRITTYDQNGLRLGYDTTNKWPSYVIMRARNSGAEHQPGSFYMNDTSVATNATVFLREAHPRFPTETSFTFRSNALPAYVEMELGLLEPETLKQYQLMVEDENPNARGFLTNKINKVHLFRQRIPIRTAVQ